MFSQLNIVLLLTCAVLGVVAPPLANHGAPQGWTQPNLILHQLDNGGHCGFEGNPELYGLGIRLGIYFQLFSSFLANHYHEEIMKDAWDTNAIFLLSIFIGIGRATISQQLQTVEAFIMLQLLFAFLLSVFQVSASITWSLLEYVEERGHQTSYHDLIRAHGEQSTSGTMARSCLRTAIAFYNVWFWYKGIEALPTQENCVPVIFLFAPVHLKKAKTFFRILSCVYIYYIGFPSLEIASIIMGCRTQWRKWDECKNSSKKSFLQRTTAFGSTLGNWYISLSLPSNFHHKKPTRGTRFGKRAMTNIFQISRLSFMIYGLVIITWAVLAIELTLRWTNISGVNKVDSVGQLIALAVGAAGLFRTVHYIVIDKLNFKSDIRKKRHLGEMPLAAGTGMWRYRLNEHRVACFYAMDAPNKKVPLSFHDYPQQHRRWSFEERPVRSLITPRTPPPMSASSDKILLPPPELPPTEILPPELLQTELRHFSTKRLFSQFLNTDEARRPIPRSMRTGNPNESTAQRIYKPYSIVRERQNQEEGHSIRSRGKSPLFRDREIQRRISISGEQEARDMFGYDLAPYSLDPSRRSSHGTISVSRPSIESFVERGVRRYLLSRDPSGPFSTRDTFERPEGRTKQFRTYVPSRRWSDGRLNGVNSENDIVPGTPVTADDEMSEDGRSIIGGHGSSDSTGDSREKKKEARIQLFAYIFIFFTIVPVWPFFMIFCGFCSPPDENKQEEEKEEEKEEEDTGHL